MRILPDHPDRRTFRGVRVGHLEVGAGQACLCLSVRVLQIASQMLLARGAAPGDVTPAPLMAW